MNVIERCPKDLKKLVNPKTGRCVLENSPIIKNLIKQGYTIIVTPGDEPKTKQDDVKVFKMCPSDSNKLLNPNTGRCIAQNNPIVKKLMKDGWTIAFNEPGVTPIVIKPKGEINPDKIKKILDQDKDGIISINEFLASKEITVLEEYEKKGVFNFLRTNGNIQRFIPLMREKNPMFKKNLCWFKQGYTILTSRYGNYATNPGNKIPKSIIANYDSISREIYPILFSAPLMSQSGEKMKLIFNPNMSRDVKKCKERFFATAITLSTSDVTDSHFRDGHSNVLFFDIKNKTIDRYDPHGSGCKKLTSEKNVSVFKCPSYDQKKIDNFLKSEFKKILPEFKFIDFEILCPYFGPQMKTESFNKDNRFGYCVTWSLMFTILRVLNPSKSVEELNNLLLDGTPSELQSKMLKFAKYYSDILKNSKNFVV